MELIVVKPAREGAIVRFPENLARVLSSEGEPVPNTKFWQRRLQGGDVVLVQEIKPEPKSKKQFTSKVPE